MRKILFVLPLAMMTAPAFSQNTEAFSGFRLEAIGGYEDFEDDGGAVYGGAVGYDGRSGNFVYGVTAELTDSSTEECSNSVFVPGDQICAQAGRNIYVGARLGGVVAGNLLLYGGLGYVNGRVNLETTSPAGAVTDAGANLDGIRATFGLEIQFSPNVFGRVELRGTQFEDDFEQSQAVGGLGIRF